MADFENLTPCSSWTLPKKGVKKKISEKKSERRSGSR